MQINHSYRIKIDKVCDSLHVFPTTLIFFIVIAPIQLQSKSLIQIGIYHPNYQIHPHFFRNHKDQHVLNLATFGCQKENLRLDGLKRIWVTRRKKNQILELSPISNEIRNLMEKSWRRLRDPEFANPRALIINKLFHQVQKASYFPLNFKKNSWGYLGLFALPLQIERNENFQLLKKKNGDYKIQVFDQNNQIHCEIRGFSNWGRLYQVWNKNKLDQVHLGPLDLKMLADFKNKKNKLSYWPSSQLIYLKFSTKYTTINNSNLRKSLYLSLPLLRISKRMIAKQKGIFALATSFIPPKFKIKKIKKTTSSYNYGLAKKLFRPYENKNKLFRIAYLSSYGKQKYKTKNHNELKDLAIEIASTLNATFNISKQYFPVTVEKINQLDEDVYELLLGVADLDHGGLITIWNQIELEENIMPEQYNLSLKKLKKKVITPYFLPLWWKGFLAIENN